MKRLLTILCTLLSLGLFGCEAEPAPETTTGQTDVTTPSESEQRYDLRGVIVDRDPMANTLKLDHEAIGDWMGAMTMSFPVRGADVQTLPENGETIRATVHVDGTEFWVSDVVAASPAPMGSDTAVEGQPIEPETEPELPE